MLLYLRCSLQRIRKMVTKRKCLKGLDVGSPEYIIAHARWQASRGRRPSLPYEMWQNPEVALEAAKVMKDTNRHISSIHYRFPADLEKNDVVSLLNLRIPKEKNPRHEVRTIQEKPGQKTQAVGRIKGTVLILDFGSETINFHGTAYKLMKVIDFDSQEYEEDEEEVA